MNRKSEIRRKLIVTTACCMLMLLNTCLKEDLSSCPEQIRVYFDIATPEWGTEINPDDVDRMNLYVFDKKGYFLCEYSDDAIAGFSPEYYIDCSDLLPGKYRFIAWAGKHEQFYELDPDALTPGKTRFEDALLLLQLAGSKVSTRIHHLFHSELPAEVSVAKVQHFMMPLKQQTNRIAIRTVGFPADNDRYSLNISDNNCCYLFDRSFANCMHSTFTYAALCAKDPAGELQSDLNVMRLAADRITPQLQIRNETTGDILFPADEQSGDLIEMILKTKPDNDFDAVHTYEIVLKFNEEKEDPTRFIITVIINGWVLNEENSNI